LRPALFRETPCAAEPLLTGRLLIHPELAAGSTLVESASRPLLSSGRVHDTSEGREAVDRSISAIIPAYSAQPLIHRAVRSVLQQTCPPSEIVIASDDGADYAHLLRGGGISDPRIRCVSTRAVRTGPANARNTALDAARGRMIATLDADDVLAPRALEILAPAARLHGAAYCRPSFVDQAAGTELESLDRVLPTGRVRLEDILTSQTHTYAGIVFDRGRVTARWPEWMERWEDVWFYVRCFDDLEFLFHVSEPLYGYHRVAGSICNRPETGGEYLAWANELVRRMDGGDTLALRNAASRDVFRRFLLSRRDIEAAFVQELNDGSCPDFHSFARRRRDVFHRLTPEPAQGAARSRRSTRVSQTAPRLAAGGSTRGR
jgi:glycosyltransferase involved in cell wall biosynthesis